MTKLIPELRFPEFVNKEEWVEKSLHEIAYFLKGKGISKADVVKDGSLPCIRYGELYTHYNETISETKSFTNLNPKELVLSEANDVIIPASGETQIDIATASCVLKSGIALGGDLNIIRSEINGVFLSYLLNNAKKSEIAQMAQGISVVHLYPSQLRSLIIEYPEFPEQRKIAACLSSLDEVISAHSQKLEALKEHKKGLMQNLFPQDGETVPKYRFPEFENDGDWEENNLGNFITSLDAGVSVNSGDRSAKENEIGILKTSCIKDGVFNYKENKVVFKEEEINRVKESVKSETIIISRMNTPALVGANAYVEKDHSNIFLPDRLWAAKSNQNGDMKFISLILSSDKGRYLLSELATGTSGSMKNISKSDVLELRIFVPFLKEQQKIASCLSSLDTLIAEQGEKIDQLKLHKKGLMQGLFPNSITNP